MDTNINFSRIEAVHIRDDDHRTEPLSFDNPDLETLKQSFPDIKIYGPAENIPKPLRRIVTESGGWVELAEGLEIPGYGVIYREFSIYGRRQNTALLVLPGCRLEAAGDDGFYRIRKCD